MNTLSEQLLLHIIKFLAPITDNKFIGFSKLIYISQYQIDDLKDDGVDCDSLEQMYEEYHHRDGSYLPLRNLYATCKAFDFLSKFEYVCIEQGEFYNNIAIRNINGVRCGMDYDLNSNMIIGCSSYVNGEILYQNEETTDTASHYRIFNGIIHYEFKNCNIRQNEYDDKCQNCINLKKIENEIFKNDPDIQKIIKSNYENNTVIIRPKSKIFNIDFPIEGYKEVK